MCDDARALEAALRQPARRSVDDLDRAHAGRPWSLRPACTFDRSPGIVSISTGSLPGTRLASRSASVVDVAERRVEDAAVHAVGVEHVDVLALPHRLDRREAARVSSPRLRGVVRPSLARALEGAMVGDVRDVEARLAMPGAHVLGVPVPAAVVRVLRVRVEVDGEDVRPRRLERGHRSRHEERRPRRRRRARRARCRRARRCARARRAGGTARSSSRRLHHHQSAQPSTSVTRSATCCRTLSSVSVSSTAEIGASSR